MLTMFVAAASISAWVTVCVAVNAQVSPTSSRPSLSPGGRRSRVRLRTNGSVDRHAGQRLVAGVLDRDRVADHSPATSAVPPRRRRVLDDVQRRRPAPPAPSVVGVGPRLIAVGGGGVDDVASPPRRSRPGSRCAWPCTPRSRRPPAGRRCHRRVRDRGSGCDTNGSTTVTPVSVWLPVFWTVIV